MAQRPSRPEARSRFGSQSANELGAPVASSIPEQLPGHEPASARKGYEDALVLRNRRVEGSSGRDGIARRVLLFGAERPSRLGDIGRAAARLLDHSDRHRRGRSEERRVGKECRSRWSPYHLKKKQGRSGWRARNRLGAGGLLEGM